MARQRTNIEIENDYVQTIMDRYGVRTKTEAVELALRHLAGHPMTRGRPSRCAVLARSTSFRKIHTRAIPSDPRRFLRVGGVRSRDRKPRRPAHDRPDHERRTVGRDGTGADGSPGRSAQRSTRSQLRRLLLRYTMLRFDAIADFEAAAGIYRRCRRVGVTPRGMVDCMIAAVAWRHGATLLANDVDLDRVATFMGIGLDHASPRH